MAISHITSALTVRRLVSVAVVAAGLMLGVALVESASATLEKRPASVTKNQKPLPREWVWKKKTVNFDSMYRH